MSQSPNLSPVSFEKWLDLIFDHRVRHNYSIEWRVSDKARVVAHMTRLCREFKAVSDRFTRRQIDQGIWFLLGADFAFGAYLADPEIDLQARLDCARTMLHPYSNYVAPSRVQVMENCFEMWWDLLSDHFWMAHLYRIKGDELNAAYELELLEDEPEAQKFEEFLKTADRSRDFVEQMKEAGFSTEPRERPSSKIKITYQELEPAEQTVADAMLDTLTQILYLEEERCASYALHGLNHLQHPHGAEVVQNFIDLHKSDWDAQTLAWVESCRDGTAM